VPRNWRTAALMKRGDAIESFSPDGLAKSPHGVKSALSVRKASAMAFGILATAVQWTVRAFNLAA
jgi:hypothetical protein